MTISQSGSVRSLGSAGGGGEGEGSPLEGLGVSNTGEEMQTGSGQVIDHHDGDEPQGCIERCIHWLSHCLSEGEGEGEGEGEEAGASGESQPLVNVEVAVGTSGKSDKTDTPPKAEKPPKIHIPKPDKRGGDVDLTTLEYDKLNVWSVEKAIDIATGALENARQTACYEYWAYKEQPKPLRDPTKVREAQRVFGLAISLVRSYIAKKTETTTAITREKLIPLGALAEQCEALHARIDKKLGKPKDPDPSSDDTDTDSDSEVEEATVVEAPQVGAEPQLGAQDPTEETGDDVPQVGEQDPPEETGGGDDEPQVGDQDSTEEAGGGDVPQAGEQDPPEETE